MVRGATYGVACPKWSVALESSPCVCGATILVIDLCVMCSDHCAAARRLALRKHCEDSVLLEYLVVFDGVQETL